VILGRVTQIWLAGLNAELVGQQAANQAANHMVLKVAFSGCRGPTLPCGPRPVLLKRYENQWFCDLRLQKHSKTYHFGNFGWEMMIPDPRDKKRQ